MKKLVLGTAVVLAAGLANAENFYWTGASGGALSTVGNWAMESGAAATKAPGQGDTVIFTNDTALSVTKGSTLNYLRYEFRGENVSLPKGSKNYRQYGYGGGGIMATGAGTYTFGYPLELNADQFTDDDKAFVVDIASGATVRINDSGTLKVYSPAHFIKRGAGKFNCDSFNPVSQVTKPGKVTFEAGTLRGENVNPKIHYFGEFEVSGLAAKTYEIYGTSQRIGHYIETPEASMTLTFNTVGGSANTYDIQLTGPYDVPRFSADLKISSQGQDNHFKWNPEGGTNAITMVDRVWNASTITMSVLGGTMRFADGAGLKSVKALNVASGAKLEIAESASMMFSGAPVALAEGAKLKVEGGEMVFKPKSLSYGGTAVPEGRYTGGDFDWLEGDGILLVSSQPGGLTYCWAGETAASFAAVENWRYANGTTAVVTPAKGDSIVFTNASDITVNKGCVGHVSDWNFLGKGVAFNPDTDRFYFYAGGVMNALGSGTVSMKHTFELQNKVAGQFDVGDRFTFNIGPDMTVVQGGTGTVNLNSPATMVKTGAGTFAGSFNASCSGTLVVQEGICQISGGNNEISLGGLLFEGPTAKTVRIDAHPQKISKYSEDSDAEGTCLISYYGIERTLTLACTEDTRMTADLYAESDNGILNVKWAPTDTTATLTYAKRVLNQGRTKFIVSAGTLKFAEGGGVKKLNGLSVSAGATLEVAADASPDFADVPVTLAEGATLKLDGPTTRLVRLSSLSVAGTAIPDGNYTKADYPAWLEGDVVLVVGEGAATEATWTGNGGDDTSIDNPANWGEAGATALPDLTRGTLVATLPAGANLSVPEGKAFALRGLVLQTSSGAGCMIGGAGSLGLGSGGLAITGGGTVTIDSTVELLLDQTWELGSEASARLVLETNAGIVGHGHVWNVRTSFADFKGEGGVCVHIKCANPRLDDSSFNCGVRVSADGALGGPNAKVKIAAGGTRPRTALQMSACTLTNGKVTISSLGSAGNYRSITTDSGACAIEGDCVVDAANYNYFNIGDGAPLAIGGTCSSSLGVNLVRMEVPVFDGYDLTLAKAASLGKFNLEKNGVIRFAAASNVIRCGVFLSKANAKIVTSADEAFRFGTGLSDIAGVGFGTGGGTWDLSGTHQSLQMLAGVGRGVITSEDAATLVLNASKDYESDHGTKAEAAPTFNLKISDDAKTFSYVDEEVAQLTDYVSFQGQVSFEKKGPKAHYLGGVSTSTGSLTVSEGLLVFKPGATWRTASSVNVTGTGVLEVEGRKIFSSATDLIVDGEATDRIRIAAGKKVIVGSLTVNGVRQSEIPAGLVTGGGTLQIGPDGMTVIVR